MIGALEMNIENFEFMETSGTTSKICHCHSKLVKSGGRCTKQFTSAQTEQFRLSMQELTRNEKGMLLLGVISTHIRTLEQNVSTKHKNREWIESRMHGYLPLSL